MSAKKKHIVIKAPKIGQVNSRGPTSLRYSTNQITTNLIKKETLTAQNSPPPPIAVIKSKNE